MTIWAGHIAEKDHQKFFKRIVENPLRKRPLERPSQMSDSTVNLGWIGRNVN